MRCALAFGAGALLGAILTYALLPPTEPISVLHAAVASPPRASPEPLRLPFSPPSPLDSEPTVAPGSTIDPSCDSPVAPADFWSSYPNGPLKRLLSGAVPPQPLLDRVRILDTELRANLAAAQSLFDRASSSSSGIDEALWQEARRRRRAAYDLYQTQLEALVSSFSCIPPSQEKEQ